MKREFSFGGYRLLVDAEKTREYYAAHPLPWVTCTCNGCRNFVQAVKLLPEEVRSFFAQLGVDPEKPGETSWFTLTPAEASGDAWYHICGTILAGGEAPEGQRFNEWLDVTEKFRAAFSPECYLLPEDFPRPCFQMDVAFALPWVLEERPDGM